MNFNFNTVYDCIPQILGQTSTKNVKMWYEIENKCYSLDIEDGNVIINPPLLVGSYCFTLYFYDGNIYNETISLIVYPSKDMVLPGGIYNNTNTPITIFSESSCDMKIYEPPKIIFEPNTEKELYVIVVEYKTAYISVNKINPGRYKITVSRNGESISNYYTFTDHPILNQEIKFGPWKEITRGNIGGHLNPTINPIIRWSGPISYEDKGLIYMIGNEFIILGKNPTRCGIYYVTVTVGFKNNISLGPLKIYSY